MLAIKRFQLAIILLIKPVYLSKWDTEDIIRLQELPLAIYSLQSILCSQIR